MPELPEVERTVRRLRAWLRGRTLEGLLHLDARELKEGTPAALAAALDHAKVASISRRAKYVLIKLRGADTLLVHLGMTGKMVRREPGQDVRWSRLAVRCSGGLDLHLVDPRLLGTIRLTPTARLKEHPSLAHIGPEPLASSFTPAVLGKALAKRKIPLKVALMDQAVVAGIGNIQSAEGLWRARLDPFRPAGSLSADELVRLVEGLRWTLTESLARDRGGETTYVSESADENPFLIYGRKGEPCPRCKKPIERKTLAGRGTYWCPNCQLTSDGPRRTSTAPRTGTRRGAATARAVRPSTGPSRGRAARKGTR